MRASFESLRSSIVRWKSARRVVLGAVVLTGALSTYAAVAMRLSTASCEGAHEVDRAYTYSGIGIKIGMDPRGRVVVRSVLPGGPADGKLAEGSYLIRVNGEQPGSLDEWTRAIRGAPGTAVNLEVASGCQSRHRGRKAAGGHGHTQVALTRDVVRVRY